MDCDREEKEFPYKGVLAKRQSVRPLLALASRKDRRNCHPDGIRTDHSAPPLHWARTTAPPRSLLCWREPDAGRGNQHSAGGLKPMIAGCKDKKRAAACAS